MSIYAAYHFVTGIWRRYFRQFYPYLESHHLDHDLYQEFEVLALSVKGIKMEEAGVIVQRGFRGFLKNVGFSKSAGSYVIREEVQGPDWWDFYYRTGRRMGH